LTGDATFATVQLGKTQDSQGAAIMVSAKASKDYRAQIGQQLGLVFSAAQCHLFDARSQLRIDAVPALPLTQAVIA